MNLQPGFIYNLKIFSASPQGYWLGNNQNQVWMPKSYAPAMLKTDNTVCVFVFHGHDLQLTATLKKPYVLLNEFGCLRVKSVEKSGYFLDWGIERDLFLPAAESLAHYKVNDYVLIYLLIDSFSNRLMASAKINKFIDLKPNLTTGDEALVLIGNASPLGYEVIANKRFKGIIYHSQVFKPVVPGTLIKAWVMKVREDGLIDFSLRMPGFSEIQMAADKIEDVLVQNYGFLELNDSSDPQLIYNTLEMSKKVFKKAVGVLYKQHKIIFEGNGIRLIGED